MFIAILPLLKTCCMRSLPDVVSMYSEWLTADIWRTSFSDRVPELLSKPTVCPSLETMSPPSCQIIGQIRQVVSSSPVPGHAAPTTPVLLLVSRFAAAAKSFQVQSFLGYGTPACWKSFLL